MCEMGGEGIVSASLDGLIAREVERVCGELERNNPQALGDNPEGAALIADALRDSLWLGIAAGCQLESCSVGELDSDRERAWEDWWQVRGQTPEARSWPAFLAEGAPRVLDQADELLASAAAELNLRGRTARNLRRAGAQAAEAGAALSRALSRKPDEPEPQEAVLGSVGDVQPDGIVRVATAANQAEAELLQGALQTAGIPSTWRRTGADLPGLLSAGYREIYVLEDAAEEARAILATTDELQPGDYPAREEQRTRKVGLERTTLRLVGKAAAALVVVGLLWEATSGLQLGWAPALVLAVVLFAAIAMVGRRSAAA
jgi:Putative prokaryotic signal transducing protein